MNRFFKIYDMVIKGILVAIVAAFIVIVFAQVVCRYVFNNSLSWSEELARTLFVEMIFLASPICVLEKRHITVDILHQYGWMDASVTADGTYDNTFAEKAAAELGMEDPYK